MSLDTKLLRLKYGKKNKTTTINNNNKIVLTFVNCLNENDLEKPKRQLTMYQFWVATLPSHRRVASVYSAQETLASTCSCLQWRHLRNMFNTAHYVCACVCVPQQRRPTGRFTGFTFRGLKPKNFTGSGFWKTRSTQQSNSPVQMGKSNKTDTGHISRFLFCVFFFCFFLTRCWNDDTLANNKEENVEMERDK